MRSLIVAVLLSLGLASAHQPLWNPGSLTPGSAFEIPQPEVSKAIFGVLQAGESAYFRLEVPAGFRLDLGLFVGGPCPEAFRPELWLLSLPGDGDRAATTPFATPEGYRASLIAGDWQPYQGHGLVGFEGPEVATTLAAGTHFAVVQAPATGGHYLLSLGGREAFGGSSEGRAAIPRFNGCS